MDEKHFEKLMVHNRKGGSDNPEKYWDSRAEEFQKRQHGGKNGYPGMIFSRLLHKGVITNTSKILEIGCGTGRYTIPFAEKCAQVVATDISDRMLDFTRQNAAIAGIDTVECRKLDWAGDPGASSIATDSFDLVYAVMCPGIQSKRSLTEMSRVSRGYCFVGQFIQSKENITDLIRKESRLSPRHDPHNSRDKTIAVVNLLWMEGLNPEILYFTEQTRTTENMDEAFANYSARLGVDKEEDRKELLSLFERESFNGELEIIRSSVMAVILWRSDIV